MPPIEYCAAASHIDTLRLLLEKGWLSTPEVPSAAASDSVGGGGVGNSSPEGEELIYVMSRQPVCYDAIEFLLRTRGPQSIAPANSRSAASKAAPLRLSFPGNVKSSALDFQRITLASDNLRTIPILVRCIEPRVVATCAIAASSDRLANAPDSLRTFWLLYRYSEWIRIDPDARASPLPRPAPAPWVDQSLFCSPLEYIVSLIDRLLAIGDFSSTDVLRLISAAETLLLDGRCGVWPLIRPIHHRWGSSPSNPLEPVGAVPWRSDMLWRLASRPL